MLKMGIVPARIQLRTNEAHWLIQRVIIPASTYWEVDRFLRSVGVGHFHFFPDLQGLSVDLKRDAQTECYEFIREGRRRLG